MGSARSAIVAALVAGREERRAAERLEGKRRGRRR